MKHPSEEVEAVPDFPFQLRGVVEGFYGLFYTFPQRNELIRFLGRHGYNLYIYGPKNDYWHRERWWEPYPPEIMAQFEETAALARQAGVTFCYSIAPGLSLRYGSEEDFRTLTAKLHAFYTHGIHSFSLLLDDIDPWLQHEMDLRRYRSHAHAQAEFCNRLYAWLNALDRSCTLSMCPTQYHGRAPFGEYLAELGESVHPEIDLFYTGPEICAPTISTADVAAFAEVVRRPPLIWDNYLVNDLSRQPEMHLAPMVGREPSLYRVAKGMVVNPMIQPEASEIALGTSADYLAAPHEYDPQRSWEQALREVAGETSFEALRCFAEMALDSCVGIRGGVELARLVAEALVGLRAGEAPSRSGAVRALEAYVAGLVDGCFFLKMRMPNLALRQELAPWIEGVEYWCWMAQRAIRALKAQERGEVHERSLRRVEELLMWATQHYKRTAASELLPLGQYVLEQAGR